MKYLKRMLLGVALLIAACSGQHGNVLPPTVAPMSITAAGVPNHVQTGEYLWSSTEVYTNPSVYAPYLTYAYTRSATQAASIQAAGIKSFVYANPVMPNGNTYDVKELTSAYPGAIAKTCAGARITVYRNTGYLTDPRVSVTASYINNLVTHNVNGFGGHADYVFIDNASSVYYNVDNPPPCGYTATAWGTALDSALSGLNHALVLNSLNVSLASIPTYVAYLKGENIRGGMFELCYNNTGQWAATEEMQLQTVALLKSEGKPGGPGFWCYRDATSALGSSIIPERIFDYASFLLTYDPDYSVFEESFSTPSTFKVFPETGLVVLDPVSHPTHYTDLKTASGAYEQTYNACYYRGSFISACMVAVNPSTSATVSIPNAYQHSLVLSGGGVLDGGTATFNGAGVTSLGPLRAAVLFYPPVATATPSPTPDPTATPAGGIAGVVTYMKYFTTSGWFEIKTTSGSYLKVFPESYTVWTNKSALAVGKNITATGYINNNGAYIASSIQVQ